MMYYRHKRILLITILVLVAVLSFFFPLRFCTSRSQLIEEPNPSSKIRDTSQIIKSSNDDSKSDIKYDKKDTARMVYTEEENCRSFLSKYGKKSNLPDFEMLDDTNDEDKWNNREVRIDDWDDAVQWSPRETDITLSDSSDDSPDGKTDDADTNDTNDWLWTNGDDDTAQTIDRQLNDGDVVDNAPKVGSNNRRNPEWEIEPAKDDHIKKRTSEDGGIKGNVEYDPSPQMPSLSQKHILSIGKNPIWLAILVILLIAFIIASIMSNRGVLVIWATPFDKFLVVASAILFFIVCVVDSGPELTDIQITLLTFSGLLVLVSIILSIIANMGSLLNTILSILSKFFVFVLVNFSLLLLLVVVLVYFMIKIARRSHDY